ncbi:hypothetical protein AVEN_7389-1 [Araneus ventricosus]|uniref:Uncharacterized protein n=1 Tax=Araneus ventricosus TaxID=182803 RepID=A0A4Y2BTE2_ARAVE|nr:hypothetical protein AVEN_7389-1 [Araneus ventricosus]
MNLSAVNFLDNSLSVSGLIGPFFFQNTEIDDGLTKNAICHAFKECYRMKNRAAITWSTPALLLESHVRAHLNGILGNRWLRRKGSIELPIRKIATQYLIFMKIYEIKLIDQYQLRSKF